MKSDLTNQIVFSHFRKNFIHEVAERITERRT